MAPAIISVGTVSGSSARSAGAEIPAATPLAAASAR